MALTVTNTSSRQVVIINGVEFRAIDPEAMGVLTRIDFLGGGVGAMAGVTLAPNSYRMTLVGGFSQQSITDLWNNDPDVGSIITASIREVMAGEQTLADWQRGDFSARTTQTDTETSLNDVTASGYLSVEGATGAVTFGASGDDNVTITGANGQRLATYQGTFGTLTLDHDGDWTYTLDTSDSDYLALNGVDGREVFTITISDSDGNTATHSLAIEVEAPPFIEVANAPARHPASTTIDTAVSPSDLTASGYLQVTGATGTVTYGTDSTATITGTGATRIATYQGTYGSLTIDHDGDWTYTLNPSDPDFTVLTGTGASDSFTITISDSATPVTATQNLTINIAPIGVENTSARQFAVINGVEFRVLDPDAVGIRDRIDFLFAGTPPDVLAPSSGTNADAYIIDFNINSLSQADAVNLWNNDSDTSGIRASILTPSQTRPQQSDWVASDFSPATTTVDLSVIIGAVTAEGYLAVTGASGTVTYGDASDANATISGTGTNRLTTYQGTYGTLTLDHDGDWLYTLNPTSADYLALTATASDEFSISISDSSTAATTHRLTITVEPTPTLVVSTITTNPSVSISPVDNTASGSFSVANAVGTVNFGTAAEASISQGLAPNNSGRLATYQGTYGVLTINHQGVWNYVFDPADTDLTTLPDGKIDSFTITIIDTASEVSTRHTLDIDIIDAPAQLTITGATQTITDTNTLATIMGDINAADADPGESEGEARAHSYSFAGTGGTVITLDATDDGTAHYSVAKNSLDYGTLTLNQATGVWGFTTDGIGLGRLGAGASETLNINAVATTPGSQYTAGTGAITITLNGIDNPPVLNPIEDVIFLVRNNLVSQTPITRDLSYFDPDTGLGLERAGVEYDFVGEVSGTGMQRSIFNNLGRLNFNFQTGEVSFNSNGSFTNDRSATVTAQVSVDGVVATQTFNVVIRNPTHTHTVTATGTGTIEEHSTGRVDTGITLTTSYAYASAADFIVSDARFDVIEDGGVFRLVALDGSAFDFEASSNPRIPITIGINDNGVGSSNRPIVTVTINNNENDPSTVLTAPPTVTHSGIEFILLDTDGSVEGRQLNDVEAWELVIFRSVDPLGRAASVSFFDNVQDVNINYDSAADVITQQEFVEAVNARADGRLIARIVQPTTNPSDNIRSPEVQQSQFGNAFFDLLGRFALDGDFTITDERDGTPTLTTSGDINIHDPQPQDIEGGTNAPTYSLEGISGTALSSDGVVSKEGVDYGTITLNPTTGEWEFTAIEESLTLLDGTGIATATINNLRITADLVNFPIIERVVFERVAVSEDNPADSATASIEAGVITVSYSERLVVGNALNAINGLTAAHGVTAVLFGTNRGEVTNSSPRPSIDLTPIGEELTLDLRATATTREGERSHGDFAITLTGVDDPATITPVDDLTFTRGTDGLFGSFTVDLSNSDPDLGTGLAAEETPRYFLHNTEHVFEGVGGYSVSANQIRFSIARDDVLNGQFLGSNGRLDRTTGVITLNLLRPLSTVDFGTQFSFDLSVSIGINGPIETFTTTLIFPPRPSLSLSSASATVAENSVTLTDTGIVLTTDFGGASGTDFTVFEGADESTRFDIIDDGGVFRLVLLEGNALDFENTIDAGEITLTVEVTDSVNNIPSQRQNITITIGDEDDLTEIDITGTLAITDTGSGVQAITADITATDQDDRQSEGETNAPAYSIKGRDGASIDTDGAVLIDGVNYGTITLDSGTGAVTLTANNGRLAEIGADEALTLNLSAVATPPPPRHTLILHGIEFTLIDTTGITDPNTAGVAFADGVSAIAFSKERFNIALKADNGLSQTAIANYININSTQIRADIVEAIATPFTPDNFATSGLFTLTQRARSPVEGDFAITLNGRNDAPIADPHRVTLHGIEFTLLDTELADPKNWGVQFAAQPDASTIRVGIDGGRDSVFYLLFDQDDFIFTQENVVNAVNNSTAVNTQIHAEIITAVEGDFRTSGGLAATGEASIAVSRNFTQAPSIALDEATAYRFSVGDFSFFDIDGDGIASITITNLPTMGSLMLGDNTAPLNTPILAADIANLTYTPIDADAPYAVSLTYRVNDGVASSSNTGTVDLAIDADSIPRLGVRDSAVAVMEHTEGGASGSTTTTPIAFTVLNFQGVLASNFTVFEVENGMRGAESTRFDVVSNGSGAWDLVLNAGVALDFESEADDDASTDGTQITLEITLTSPDASDSEAVSITLANVNEATTIDAGTDRRITDTGTPANHRLMGDFTATDPDIGEGEGGVNAPEYALDGASGTSVSDTGVVSKNGVNYGNLTLDTATGVWEFIADEDALSGLTSGARASATINGIVVTADRSDASGNAIEVVFEAVATGTAGGVTASRTGDVVTVAYNNASLTTLDTVITALNGIEGISAGLEVAGTGGDGLVDSSGAGVLLGDTGTATLSGGVTQVMARDGIPAMPEMPATHDSWTFGSGNSAVTIRAENPGDSGIVIRFGTLYSGGGSDRVPVTGISIGMPAYHQGQTFIDIDVYAVTAGQVAAAINGHTLQAGVLIGATAGGTGTGGFSFRGDRPLVGGRGVIPAREAVPAIEAVDEVLATTTLAGINFTADAGQGAGANNTSITFSQDSTLATPSTVAVSVMGTAITIAYNDASEVTLQSVVDAVNNHIGAAALVDATLATAGTGGQTLRPQPTSSGQLSGGGQPEIIDLDFEAVATDQNGNDYSDDLTITLEGRNDAPILDPVADIEFRNGDTTSITLDLGHKDADTGAGELGEAGVTLPALGYRINGEDGGRIAITDEDGTMLATVTFDSSTGMATVTADQATLDALGPGEIRSIELALTVTDAHGGVSTAEMVTLTLRPAPPPSLTATGTGEVAENISTQTNTGISFSTDYGGASGTDFTVYESDGAVSTRFGVVESGGGVFSLALLADNAINFETEQDDDTTSLGTQINLSVAVSHGAIPSAQQNITITVADSNDPTTVDAGTDRTLTDTGIGVHRLMGDIDSTDEDVGAVEGGTNAPVYAILGTVGTSVSDSGVVAQNGVDYGTITVDSATGVWEFTAIEAALSGLNADATITLGLTAQATDTNSNAYSDDFAITLRGINDAPVIAPESIGNIAFAPTVNGELPAPITRNINHSDADLGEGEGDIRPASNYDITGTGFRLGHTENGATTDANGNLLFRVESGLTILATGVLNRATGEVTFTVNEAALRGLQVGEMLEAELSVSVRDINGVEGTEDFTLTLLPPPPPSLMVMGTGRVAENVIDGDSQAPAQDIGVSLTSDFGGATVGDFTVYESDGSVSTRFEVTSGAGGGASAFRVGLIAGQSLDFETEPDDDATAEGRQINLEVTLANGSVVSDRLPISIDVVNVNESTVVTAAPSGGDVTASVVALGIRFTIIDSNILANNPGAWSVDINEMPGTSGVDRLTVDEAGQRFVFDFPSAGRFGDYTQAHIIGLVNANFAGRLTAEVVTPANGSLGFITTLRAIDPEAANLGGLLIERDFTAVSSLSLTDVDGVVDTLGGDFEATDPDIGEGEGGVHAPSYSLGGFGVTGVGRVGVDADGNALFNIASMGVGYGQIALNQATGEWVFSENLAGLGRLRAGETQVLELRAIAIDAGGRQYSDAFNITLNGTNNAPIINPIADITLTNGASTTATIDITHRDFDLGEDNRGSYTLGADNITMLDDDDPTAISFNIIDDDGSNTVLATGVFNSLTGAMTVTANQAVLDAIGVGETRSVELSLTASDRHGAESTAQTLTITLNPAPAPSLMVSDAMTALAENNITPAVTNTDTGISFTTDFAGAEAGDFVIYESDGTESTRFAVAQDGGGGTGVFKLVLLANQGVDFERDDDDSTTAGTQLNLAVELRHGAIPSARQDITLTIEGVNEGPLASTTANLRGDEDTAYSLSLAQLQIDDLEGDAITSIALVDLPQFGSLSLNGEAVVTGQMIAVDMLSGLTYTPANRTADYSDSFTYRARDDMDNIGNLGRLNFTITANNDATVLVADNANVGVDRGEAIILSQRHLNASDVETTSTGLIYTITGLTAGVLERSTNGVWTALAVTTGTFTQADIDAGRLRFTTDADAMLTLELTAGEGGNTITPTIEFTLRQTEPIAGTGDAVVIDYQATQDMLDAAIATRDRLIGERGLDGVASEAEMMAQSTIDRLTGILETPRSVETGVGDSSITTGSGDDVIDAGAGDDVIDLSLGGDDVAVYRFAPMVSGGYVAWDGGDRITGFTPGEDVLVFSSTGDNADSADELGEFVAGLGSAFRVTLELVASSRGTGASIEDYDVAGLDLNFPQAASLPGGRLSGSVLQIEFADGIAWGDFNTDWLGADGNGDGDAFDANTRQLSTTAAGRDALARILGASVELDTSRGVIIGTSGDDTGDDALIATAAQVIFGQGGDDTITLDTGAQEVVYRLSDNGSAVTSSDGTDTINDFTLGEDMLRFVDTDGSDNMGNALTLEQLLTRPSVSVALTTDAITFTLDDNDTASNSADDTAVIVNFATGTNVATRLGLAQDAGIPSIPTVEQVQMLFGATDGEANLDVTNTLPTELL